MHEVSLGELSRLEELRSAKGLEEIASDWRPLGSHGGVMSRAAPGSWLNNAVGAGVVGEVSESDVDELIDFHTAAGSEPRIEVSPFADPSLLKALERRQFVVRAFDNVFYRELSTDQPVTPIHQMPVSVSCRIVDSSDDAAAREHAIVAISGFLQPGAEPSECDVQASIRCIRHPRTVGAIAVVDGRCVGAGAMEVAGDVAGLFGTSVLPAYRREGIQQALLAFRLNIAAARGARFATIGGRPGAGTERNVRRMGFALAYTKATLVRPGPGLAAVAT